MSADSYTAGPTDPPLIEETIDANFRATVAAHPDREALVVRHQGVRWSYTELDTEIDRLARALLASGLTVGDRVALWSPNRYEWVLAQYATARIGVIMVCINPAYRTHELEFALNQSGSVMLLAAPEFKTSNYRQMWADVAEQCPDIREAIFFDDPTWDALLERAEKASTNEVKERSESLVNTDPINIQYTSGTTGLPKGATLTHRNILNNGYFVGEGCGYTEHDRVCIPVPFYHCFGMVMGNLGCTSHGSTMVIPNDAFEPVSVLEAVQDEKCTSLYGVPTMFIAELGVPEFESYDLSSLRTGIMAGSPCPVEVMKQVIERMNMDEVTIAYGMTETSPVSTQTGADDSIDQRVGSVGRVHPHVEIRVADPETGETVARGESGEFQTRGYSVMEGYWNEEEKTAQAIDAEGWMHTGDLAVMDVDGYVNITGRIKDLIIRGGENISPREIEEFLYGHPDIIDVQVVGVPDEKFGEEVCAFIQARDGASVDTDAVREFCQGKIAHYKVPRYVLSIEDFPMTVTGKIQKYLLRDAAVEQLGLSGFGTTA
ncbi:MAG TPA: AMP-binding protein [Acidimicrobiaceae bacterium]|nr:AMP-binding protein [Acidimicrobiaceae bacterium]